MSKQRDDFEAMMGQLYPNLNLGSRWGATYRTPHIDAMWRGFKMAWKDPSPTHYLVTDEYGNILHSAKMNDIEDAKKQCDLFLKVMRQDKYNGEEAKSWTVKGVTVHD